MAGRRGYAEARQFYQDLGPVQGLALPTPRHLLPESGHLGFERGYFAGRSLTTIRWGTDGRIPETDVLRMLFLHKLLPIFVLPVGIVTSLLLLTLWRRKRWPVFVAAIVLYVSSTSLVGTRLIGWLESRYPAVPVEGVETADAVVVLSGILGPQVSAGMLPNLSEGIERFEAGVAIAQANKAPMLVFTGGRIPWAERKRTEGDELRDHAIRRGVHEDRIIVTREVGNTAEESVAVAELMAKYRWRRVILVTTGWHMPRSAYLFRQARVDCIIFPVDFRVAREGGLTFLDFLPGASGLNNTETALREIYGNLYYRLFW